MALNVVYLALVAFALLVNNVGAKELGFFPSDLDYFSDGDHIFGNDTYSEKIFNLRPKKTNTNTINCATNGRCCRYRCPLAAPWCATYYTATFQCSTVNLAAIPGPGTVAGVQCIVRSNCDQCFTDSSITCNGRMSCTQTPGSDICPWANN